MNNFWLDPKGRELFQYCEISTSECGRFKLIPFTGFFLIEISQYYGQCIKFRNICGVKLFFKSIQNKTPIISIYIKGLNDVFYSGLPNEEIFDLINSIDWVENNRILNHVKLRYTNNDITKKFPVELIDNILKYC